MKLKNVEQYPLIAEIYVDAQSKETKENKTHADSVFNYILHTINPLFEDIENQTTSVYYYPDEEHEVNGVEYVRYCLKLQIICRNYLITAHLSGLLSNITLLIHEALGYVISFQLAVDDSKTPVSPW